MIERSQAQLGAATWGDLLARRRGALDRHPFVGRRYEQEQFRLNYLYEVPQVLLYVLVGPPGIGKTALLTRLRTIAAEHGGITALVDRGSVSLPREFAVLQVMETLADQLAAVNMPLTGFRETHRETMQAIRTVDTDTTAPGRVWDLFGGVSDPDPWAQRAWDTYLTRTLPLRQFGLLRDPVQTLTDRFVQDLNAWAVVRRVTLCFDAWQDVEEEPRPASTATSPSPETWLTQLLCSGRLSTNIWSIIATRLPLSAEWEPLAPVTRVFELQPLPKKEAAALVEKVSAGTFGAKNDMAQNNGRSKPALADADAAALVERVGGNPLHLALLASAGRIVEGQAADEVACLTSYLDSLKPAQQAGLLKCTAARRLDEGVLTVLLGEDGARDASTWLASSPVWMASEDGYQLRPALREPLTQLARARIGLAWEAAHATLFAYYRQALELRGPGARYLDPVWRCEKLEALYHELVGGEETGGLQHMLLSFLDGIQHFYPWAGAVALSWMDAVRVKTLTLRPAASSKIASKVHTMWTALIERDWEHALALVDEIMGAEDLAGPTVSPETRERLQVLRNLVASRRAMPPEEEAVAETPAPSATANVAAHSGAEDGLAAKQAEPGSDTDVAVQALDAGVVTQDGAEVAEMSDGGGTECEGKTDDARAVELCSEANAHLGQQDYETAIRGYDDALALNPGYVAAYYNRGIAYSHTGALDSAIADFTQVLSLDPGQALAHRQRGLIYARKGDYTRAIQDYDAALAVMNGATPRARAGGIVYDRANAHFHLQSYDQAIADYTAALEYAPDHVKTHLNRGLAYAATGNHPEALRDFNRAIALAPRHAPAYYHRGQVYARTERYTEALKDYEQALELDPRYAACHNNRGLLYTKIEAYPEAVEAYQRAMALQPDWATPYYNAACVAALMQDADQACVWLARAIGLREAYRAMALRDPDLVSIRQHPEFQVLVQAQGQEAGRRAKP